MQRTRILRPISEGQSVIIKPTTGERLIYRATDVFGSIDRGSFTRCGMTNPGIPTGETSVLIHEMIEDGTYMDIFRDLPGGWEESFVTQDQVIEFCRNSAGWLRTERYATMFLVPKNERRPVDVYHPENSLEVVSVMVIRTILFVTVNHLDYGVEIRGDRHMRIVSPVPEP